jgi:hypothetical protein
MLLGSVVGLAFLEARGVHFAAVPAVSSSDRVLGAAA